MVIAVFFSKPFVGQGSRAKYEKNEWDVHVVENLIILKMHYCLHDLKPSYKIVQG